MCIRDSCTTPYSQNTTSRINGTLAMAISRTTECCPPEGNSLNCFYRLALYGWLLPILFGVISDFSATWRDKNSLTIWTYYSDMTVMEFPLSSSKK